MATVAKQTDNQEARDDGGQAGYYRSQQEVDHAFGRRLAHERAKWEQAQKEAQRGQEEAPQEAAEEASPAPAEAQEGEAAQLEALVQAMAQHEQQAPATGPEGMIERATDAAIGDNAHAAFLIDIAQQAEALSLEMDFDLAREMENPVFAMLLATGAPLKDVMEYVHPEQKATRLRADAERDVLERIRARNQRPLPLQRANAPQTQLDISALSDEQIREIDRRVKRGERVVI